MLPLWDKWKKQIIISIIAGALATGTALPPDAYKPLITAIYCVFQKCEIKK